MAESLRVTPNLRLTPQRRLMARLAIHRANRIFRHGIDFNDPADEPPIIR